MILWIYRSLLRPIEKMEIAVKSITEGELDFELRPEKNDEIGQLCKDIETMRRRLKDNAEEKLKNDKSETKQRIFGKSCKIFKIKQTGRKL